MHFATTATLLYRSLGYPARFVSGYSAVVEKTTTLVPDYAAHAWTEIWIDGLGWIPVDVTPAEYRGAGFGDGDCIRINAALPHALVREAMDRLEKYVFVG